MTPLLAATVAELERRWRSTLAADWDSSGRLIDAARMRREAIWAARRLVRAYAGRPSRLHRPGAHPSERLPVRGSATAAWLRAHRGSGLAAPRNRGFRHAVLTGDDWIVWDRPVLGTGRAPRPIDSVVADLFRWPWCGTDGWLTRCPRDRITDASAAQSG